MLRPTQQLEAAATPKQDNTFCQKYYDELYCVCYCCGVAVWIAGFRHETKWLLLYLCELDLCVCQPCVAAADVCQADEMR